MCSSRLRKRQETPAPLPEKAGKVERPVDVQQPGFASGKRFAAPLPEKAVKVERPVDAKKPVEVPEGKACAMSNAAYHEEGGSSEG